MTYYFNKALLNLFYQSHHIQLFILKNNDCTYQIPSSADLPSAIIKQLTAIPDKISCFTINNQLLVGQIKKGNHSIIAFYDPSSDIRHSKILSFSQIQEFPYKVSLLHYLMFQSISEIPELIEFPDSFSIYTYSLNENQDTNHNFFNGYLSEQEMLMAIEKGDLVLFNNIHRQFRKNGNFGILGDNDLRSKKNLAIAATTLFTRAAIRGGVYSESAYALSDDCIQKTEKLKNIGDILEYNRSIGELFVKRVANSKRKDIPSIIYSSQEYIYDHLNTTITVSDIAKHVKCSNSYLMALFKKYTGSSIKQFIIQQRTDEAKRLLMFSSKSISEISVELGYNSQSEFSKQFKSKMNVSPFNFRKLNKVHN